MASTAAEVGVALLT